MPKSCLQVLLCASGILCPFAALYITSGGTTRLTFATLHNRDLDLHADPPPSICPVQTMSASFYFLAGGKPLQFLLRFSQLPFAHFDIHSLYKNCNIDL